MYDILLCYEYDLLREGIKRLVESEADFHVAAEVGSSDELFTVIEHRRFDLVILDCGISGKSGIDCVRHLHSLYPQSRILMLGFADHPHFIKASLLAGASGYFSKHCDHIELLSAIRKLLNGRRYISPDLAQSLIFEKDVHTIRLPHEQLTGREYQVYQSLLEGQAINQIAQDLSISEKTVSTYKVRLMRKLAVKNNTELISYGYKAGLIRNS